MRVHFALRDVATLRFENVFDRVFERDDVLASLDVHLLDQRRQRRGFSAADRTGDENEAVLIPREQLEMLGQTELIHRANARVNDAKDDIGAEPLPDHTCAKAAETVRVGEVGIATASDLCLARIR